MAAVLGATYLGANTASHLYARNKVFNTEAIFDEPPSDVSIIFPVYREPRETLERALASLKSQRIILAYPKKFEFIYAGTNGDSTYDAIFVRGNFDKQVLSARGKLNARTDATEIAEGDIIVSVDADSEYPPSWLGLMLEPYRQPDVVGTTGSTMTASPLTDIFFRLPALYLQSHLMVGRASTYKRQAFYDARGFDLSVDQTNIHKIYREEEMHFRQRLEALGRIVFVDAPVVHFYPEGPSDRGIRTQRYVMARGKRAL